MFQIVESERKTAVLKHPSLPCLVGYHAVNLLSGCPYECRYCYTQSYSSHPGWGRVVFYANTVELLKRELARRRERVRLVYFSTACEPFVDDAKILDQLFEAMRVLLERSVSILISTKSVIPDNFLDLFERYRDLVHVQAGLMRLEFGG